MVVLCNRRCEYICVQKEDRASIGPNRFYFTNPSSVLEKYKNRYLPCFMTCFPTLYTKSLTKLRSDLIFLNANFQKKIGMINCSTNGIYEHKKKYTLVFWSELYINQFLYMYCTHRSWKWNYTRLSYLTPHIGHLISFFLIRDIWPSW